MNHHKYLNGRRSQPCRYLGQEYSWQEKHSAKSLEHQHLLIQIVFLLRVHLQRLTIKFLIIFNKKFYCHRTGLSGFFCFISPSSIYCDIQVLDGFYHNKIYCVLKVSSKVKRRERWWKALSSCCRYINCIFQLKAISIKSCRRLTYYPCLQIFIFVHFQSLGNINSFL